MKQMRWIGVVVLASVLTALAAGLLDGTKWKLTVKPDEAAAAKGEKEFDDEAVFAEGQVTFTKCVESGFTKSRYLARQREEEITWKTTQESSKEGMAYWSGAVKGDTITGELEWTKADSTVLQYTFTGTKQ